MVGLGNAQIVAVLGQWNPLGHKVVAGAVHLAAQPKPGQANIGLGVKRGKENVGVVPEVGFNDRVGIIDDPVLHRDPRGDQAGPDTAACAL